MHTSSQRPPSSLEAPSTLIRTSLVLLAALLLMLAPAAAQTAQPSQPPAKTAQPAAPSKTPAEEAPAQNGATQQRSPQAPAQPAANDAKATSAEQPGLAALKKRMERFPLELQRLEKATSRLARDGGGLEKLQEEIETLKSEIADTIAKLQPYAPRIKAQIDQLGPEPKNGERTESPEVASERAKLNTALSDLEGTIARMRLTDERASQLLARVASQRRALLTRNLLQTSPEPLIPSVAKGLGQDGVTAAYQIATVFQNWFEQLAGSGLISFLILLASVLLYVLLIRLRDLWLTGVFQAGDDVEDQTVAFLRRTKVAAFIAPAFALPRLATGAFAATTLVAFGLSNWQIKPILTAMLIGFAVYTVVSALTRAVLLPHNPRLRLVGIDTPSATRISRIIRLLTLIWCLDYALVTAVDALSIAQPVATTIALISNLAFAGLLILLVNTRVQPEHATDGGRLMSHILGWLRWPAYLTAFAVVIASLLGYLTLGRFIIGQVMLIGTGGFAAFLIHRAIEGITALEIITRAQTATGNAPVTTAGAGATPPPWWHMFTGQRVARVLRFILNALLILLAIPALFLSWGFSATDIWIWTRTLIFGFEIGSVRVSPARILFAIAIFVGLLLLTRLIQRWMQGTVLTPRRVDPGLAHSIHQFMGYAGIGLAALAGVSYAGLDITNLAIVAGALSVGIGFGLQSIVNNFVSGLILLVERPIKVGDWIVVGENQGYVRKISVRSTEIETFDRASLILPNSELITGTVQNWTLRNTMGRLVIPVGVSYDSDPDEVIAILERIAHDSPRVLRHPPPFVTFEGLGASSLDFALRVYLDNVNNMLTAKTELLVAIVKQFRTAAIEIPYPQQDLHLRDLDGIRSALTKAALERAMNPPPGPASPSGPPAAAPKSPARPGESAQDIGPAGDVADFSAPESPSST